MAASVRSNCLPTVHESVATDQSTQTSSASKPGIDSRISSIKPGSNVATRTQRRAAEEPHIGRYKVSKKPLSLALVELLHSTESLTHTKFNILSIFQLLKTIGKGNFAKVKLAKHIPTGKEVAIKIIDKTQLNPSSLQKVTYSHTVLHVECKEKMNVELTQVSVSKLTSNGFKLLT